MKYLSLLLLVTTLAAKEYTYDQLILAVIEVESNGIDTAIGDNGKAYGPLQIWEVVIKDVNKFYNASYTHDMMFNRGYAIDVFVLYTTYWGNFYTKKTGKKATNEIYARIHNGGPFGYNKKSTEKYWKKIKKALNKL